MFTREDIAVVIPTYNRPDDLKKTLDSLNLSKIIPKKIIVIDQSKNNSSELVCKSYKKLNIEYIHNSKPSTGISGNMGLVRVRKKFALILTLDDDVQISKNYFQEALKIFNSNPKIVGIGGADKSRPYNFRSAKSILSRLFLSVFFLPRKENHKFRITGPYGNTESPIMARDIPDAQWLPGTNMFYRSEIYDHHLWPEIPGYNVLQDIECSYKVYRKYGPGSLLITPKCRVNHSFSEVERYPERKRIFVSQEDRFSFYYEFFNTPLGTLKMVWSITGLIIGNTARAIFNPSKKNFLHLKYVLSALSYCVRYRDRIKKGIVRSFLNPDLSMKEKF